MQNTPNHTQKTDKKEKERSTYNTTNVQHTTDLYTYTLVRPYPIIGAD